MRKRESSDLFAFPVRKEYVHSRDAKLMTLYIIDNRKWNRRKKVTADVNAGVSPVVAFVKPGKDVFRVGVR